MTQTPRWSEVKLTKARGKAKEEKIHKAIIRKPVQKAMIFFAMWFLALDSQNSSLALGGM